MSNATFNQAKDYFKLVAAQSPKLKVVSSNENRSIQTASGANSYGDAAVVDSYGETAAPSAEYQVIAAMAAADLPVLGKLIAAADANLSIGGTAHPVVLGSISISTQTGSAPTLSASGQMVQSGATQLRAYPLPAFVLSPRHRAQDFLGLCSIKKGTAAASDIDDYGLSSVNATFPIEFTLAQPQGVVMNYDLHGGMATVDYTMNWYSGTAPTIALTAAAAALGATMSNLASRSDPDNGYTQYTWQVSFPLVGEEYEEASEEVSSGT